jgi:hypothetical protein
VYHILLYYIPGPWEKYIREGLELLKTQEADYNRPPPETDRLYMNVGDEQVA